VENGYETMSNTILNEIEINIFKGVNSQSFLLDSCFSPGCHGHFFSVSQVKDEELEQEKRIEEAVEKIEQLNSTRRPSESPGGVSTNHIVCK